MDAKLLLLKSITLLYRESQLKESAENSSELVKTVLETIQVPEANIGLNTDRDVIRSLKETCLEMSMNPPDYEYDLVSLLQTLRMNCGYDERLFDNIESSLKQDIRDNQIKRNVVGLRVSISNYFKSKQIEDILTKASSDFKYRREKIGDINTFVGSVIGQLESLQISTTSKDPAVITDIDISDQTATTNVFKEIKTANSKDGVLITGWQDLNLMLQGGFRRGEFICSSALQHKFKTGFSLSIFEDVARYNTPYLLNPNRRPLLLRISFEDDLKSNLQFIYQRLKYEEYGEPVDIHKLNVDEIAMADYVKSKLGVNGFAIKMMRVDPSGWTYRNICNKIIELEAEGYEIIFCMLDYLAMIPTTGCTIGPMGTDIRDLFRRIRNFMSA